MASRGGIVTAWILFMLAILVLGGMIAMPAVLAGAESWERLEFVSLRAGRAQLVLDSKDDLLTSLKEREAQLSLRPGYGSQKSRMLFAAEATQLGSSIFSRHGAQVTSSQVLDSAQGNEDGKGIRVILTASCEQSVLHSILYDLEFGAAAFTVESATIRGSKKVAGKGAPNANPRDGSSELLVEVTLIWPSLERRGESL